MILELLALAGVAQHAAPLGVQAPAPLVEAVARYAEGSSPRSDAGRARHARAPAATRMVIDSR